MKVTQFLLVLGFHFVPVPCDGLVRASAVSKSDAAQVAGANPKQDNRQLAARYEQVLKRVAEAQADVEAWAKRAAWSAHLAKKCFPRIQAEADQARLEAAKAILMQALKELSELR